MAECRQKLAAEGKAYPKSSCAVCGPFAPRWRECDLIEAGALSFLYVLLGNTPDTAARILKANPELRNKLHKAIYEYKPSYESYEDMMKRLAPEGLPN